MVAGGRRDWRMGVDMMAAKVVLVQGISWGSGQQRGQARRELGWWDSRRARVRQGARCDRGKKGWQRDDNGLGKSITRPSIKSSWVEIYICIHTHG
jgi:hypothetical protein